MKNPIKYISADKAYIDPEDTKLNVDCTIQATSVYFSQAAKNYRGSFTVIKTDSGTNAVTIYPYTGETIDGSASTTLSEYGEYKTFEPVSGGWVVSDSSKYASNIAYGRNHIYYVDGSRTDTYTADGSIYRPYKTILAAATAINTISATLLGSAANFELCKFIINVAPGKYTDNFSLSTARYIRINMEGAEISGNITITQNQLGLSDYYSKVEFVGANGNRANRGNCGLISGNITFLKDAYDSLAYDVFKGINVSGNISYGTAAAATHGTWVLCLENAYISGSDKFISEYLTDAGECVILETYGYNYIKAHLAKQNGDATKINLYDCNNTTFDLINITPTEDCLIKNCTFASDVSIVAAKNLKIDANSSMSLFAQTETLTGMTIVALDGVLKTSAAVATRAAARTLLGDGVAVGTILVSVGAVATTKPHVYIKVLAGPGDTDWERIVTQASD